MVEFIVYHLLADVLVYSLASPITSLSIFHSSTMTAKVQTSLPDQILNPATQPTPPLSFLPFLSATYPAFGQPSKLDRPLCEDYRKGHCPRGPACPDRHYTPPNERAGIGHLICKHYQRGLCKKGDACEFAHTFDLRGERECKEFSRFGVCPQGDECMYGPSRPRP